MDGHAVGSEEAAGYVLPRDSQRLLAQVSSHLHFLARLAQPRAADEPAPCVPAVGMAGWVACLEPLAAQLEQVLGALVWPAQPMPVDAVGALPQAAAGRGDAALAACPLPAPGPGGQAGPGRWAFGLTLDQLDTLHRLAQGITAFGDAVSADGMVHAAPGTVPVLGQAVVERAHQLAALLGQVEAQRLQAPELAGHAVGEARATYGAPVPGLDGVDGGKVQAGMPVATAGARHAAVGKGAARAARHPMRAGWSRQAMQGGAGGRP